MVVGIITMVVVVIIIIIIAATATVIGCFLCALYCAKHFTDLNSFNFVAALQNGCCYYPHFIAAETKAQRGYKTCQGHTASAQQSLEYDSELLTQFTAEETSNI